MDTVPPLYKGFRYPAEVISHCVWLYHRFPLSFREVEELMLERGVVVSCETVRQWCAKFGQAYANGLRRRRPRPGGKWYMDEVFIKINGKIQYLWRAVDQDGNVLDILVQPRRNAKAAKRFFRRLLKDCAYVPRVIVTDKLRSYGAAHREAMPSVEHRSSKYLNNRAENSHQPTRQRERAMRRFTSPGHAQRFLSAFSGISPHFRPRRHLLTTRDYRTEMTNRFTTWNKVTGCVPAGTRQAPPRPHDHPGMPQPPAQPHKLTVPPIRLPRRAPHATAARPLRSTPVTDSSKKPRRDGELSHEQVALLVEQFTGQTNRIGDITAMLIQYGRGPLQPDLEKAARVQIEQAAGTTSRQGGMREHLHQRTAASLLATVWFAGQHHLVEADDWPDTLPATVLGAIRQAPAINDDPTMRNLRDTGDPNR